MIFLMIVVRIKDLQIGLSITELELKKDISVFMSFRKIFKIF